jgi:spore coat polysaccharide biosynthesis protein SpsF
MRRVIIVQARMTSTRLPGKVLMDVAGKPMLSQQLKRLRRCTAVDEIVIATTTNATDDPVVDLARHESVPWFRGPEHDVLSRYVGAARQERADVVVRITADCPLIDPTVTDRVITELIERIAACDYASNSVERSYPRGLDAEALFIDTLLRADRLARTATDREHVTPLIYAGRPDLFLVHSIVDAQDNSDLRWTVDVAADLEVVRMLYDALDLANDPIGYLQIAAWVRDHPEILKINAGIETWTPGR